MPSGSRALEDTGPDEALSRLWDAMEATVPRDKSQDYPVCVGFRGDSPVEY